MKIKKNKITNFFKINKKIKLLKLKYHLSFLNYSFSNFHNRKKFKKILTIKHFIAVEKFPFEKSLYIEKYNYLIKQEIISIFNNIKKDIKSKKLDDKLFFQQDTVVGIKDNKIYYNILLNLINNYEIIIKPLQNHIFIQISLFILKKSILNKFITYLRYVYFSKAFDNILFDAYIKLEKMFNIESFCNTKYIFYRPIVKYYVIVNLRNNKFIYKNLKISDKNVLINKIKKYDRYFKKKINESSIYLLEINKNKIIINNYFKIIKISLKNNLFPNFVILNTLKENYLNYIIKIKPNSILIYFILCNFKKNSKKDLKYIENSFAKHFLLRLNEFKNTLNIDVNMNYEECYNIHQNMFFDHNNKILLCKKNNFILTELFNISGISLNPKISLFLDLYLFCRVIKRFKLNQNIYIPFLIQKNNILNQLEKRILYHLNCQYYKCYCIEINETKCFLENKILFCANIIKRIFHIVYLTNLYPKFNSSKDPYFIRRKMKLLIIAYNLFFKSNNNFDKIVVCNILNNAIDIIKLKKDTITNIHNNFISLIFQLCNKNIKDIVNYFNLHSNKMFLLNTTLNKYIITNLKYFILINNINRSNLFFSIIKRIEGILKECNFRIDFYQKLNLPNLIKLLKLNKNEFSNNFLNLLLFFKDIKNISNFQIFIDKFTIFLKYLFDNFQIKNPNDNDFYCRILCNIKKIFLYLFIF